MTYSEGISSGGAGCLCEFPICGVTIDIIDLWCHLLCRGTRRSATLRLFVGLKVGSFTL